MGDMLDEKRSCPCAASLRNGGGTDDLSGNEFA